MEFTQGFRRNYSAGKTDRLEVELSIIYFSKHSLLPHPGISEMLSFRLDHVHGLDRYNSVVSHVRGTNQRRTHIHFPYFALLHISDWHLYCPCVFRAFGALHQSGWAPSSHYHLDSQSKTHLLQDQSIFLTAFAFQGLLFLLLLLFFKFPSVISSL